MGFAVNFSRTLSYLRHFAIVFYDYDVIVWSRIACICVRKIPFSKGWEEFLGKFPTFFLPARFAKIMAAHVIN